MTNNRGAVLLLVLLLLLVLTTIVVQFMYGTRVDTRIADAHVALVKNRAAISGGVAKAISLLLQDMAEEDKTDSCVDSWATGGGVIEFDDTTVFLLIEDEQGKLNLNDLAIKGAQGTRMRDKLGRLVGALGYFETDALSIAESIADWIDSDSQGAYESDAPNVRLTDLSEIFRIPEMTDLVLYGRVSDEGEGVEEDEIDGFLRYVTIWGTGRVNINTASAEVLASSSEEMDLAIAETIVEFRQEESVVFLKATDLLQIDGVTTNMVNQLRSRACTKSSYYSVLCFAQTGRIRSVGIAIVMRDSKGCRVVRTSGGSGQLWQLYEEDMKDEDEEGETI